MIIYLTDGMKEKNMRRKINNKSMEIFLVSSRVCLNQVECDVIFPVLIQV